MYITMYIIHKANRGHNNYSKTFSFKYTLKIINYLSIITQYLICNLNSPEFYNY